MKGLEIKGINDAFTMLYTLIGIGLICVVLNIILLVLYGIRRKKHLARVLLICCTFMFPGACVLLFIGERTANLAGILCLTLGILNLILPVIRNSK